ncbi:MAG TPA: hypothetical protein VK395_12670 [Gemmataceae bacterium]|nr:hypothetical protein [Gemmataceae bacterium]
MHTETTFEETQSDHEVKPRYCVLKIDETENWLDQDIVARAKRIFGVYLFDRHTHVHCCELTPSYECLFVESQWDNPDLSDLETDWLSADILQGDNYAEPVKYFHCWQIDGLRRIKDGEIAVGVINLEIDNEEEALEYVRQRGV